MPFESVYQTGLRRWSVAAITVTLLILALAGEVGVGDNHLEVWAGHQETTLQQQADAIQESVKKAQTL
jgi:hypothetical protein